MAPGCTSILHQKDQHSEQYKNKDCSDDFDFKNTANNQIPLPSTPHPDDEQTKTKSILTSASNNSQLNSSLDTIDSFEILEQTIMKQKRIAKMKNTDLRLKVLLKRTFNLVCEIMDHENGFDTEPAEDSEDTDSVSEIKETSHCVSNLYNQDDEHEEEEEDNSSDEEDDDDETDSDSDDDDYVHESINFNKVISVNESIQDDEMITSSSQEDGFQNIDLKEYNFYELGENSENVINTSHDQALDKSNNDEHYISLEPIVTYIEQQSISNKRKLSDEFEQELFTKRHKSKRSFSSSDDDDENDEKHLLKHEDYHLESNSNCYLSVDQHHELISSNENNNFKLIIKSTDTKGYKLASINFYA